MNRLVARTLLRRSTFRSGTRYFHSSTPARFAEEATTGEIKAKLNFALPYRAICQNETIHSVVIPGLVGEYEVSGNHQAVVSELKPGVVKIYKTEGGEPERYFVSGGFALTHEDATTDISAADGFPLEELDPSTASKGYLEAKQKYEAAAPDTKEKTFAQIEMEAYEAICVALGVTPS